MSATPNSDSLTSAIAALGAVEVAPVANIPEATMREAQMAKAHFPYRRVWVYREGETWGVIVRVTAVLANSLARKGCLVYEVNANV